MKTAKRIGQRVRRRSVLQMSAWLFLAGLSILLAGRSALAQNAQRLRGDQIISDSAKAFVSVPDPAHFRAVWRNTELGKMFHDPAMDEFGEDLRRQIDEKLSQTDVRLGLRLSDLEGVAGGEVAFAMVRPDADGPYAISLLADVTGRQKQVNELTEKVRAELKLRNGQSKQVTLAGHDVTVWTFPPTMENPVERSAYFCRHQDWYLSSDHEGELVGMLQRIDGQGNDVLAKSPAYATVMQRCQEAAGTSDCELRWFLEPFGLTESIRESQVKRERGRDRVRVLREQGFDVIQGIGGTMLVGQHQCDAVYHTFIHAPQDQLRLAAQMLRFPSEPRPQLPPWAQRDFSTFLAGNWRMKEAFEASKTLVDGLAGSEVFEQVLRDIAVDQNGLQVDLRKEFVAFLGQRVFVATQHEVPITPQSEQLLIAIELTQADQVAARLQRALRRDPSIKYRDFNGKTVWEIIDMQKPQKNPQGFNQFRNNNGQGAGNEPRQFFKNGAMAVAFGYFLYSSDVEFLGEFVNSTERQASLGREPDFVAVEKIMDTLTGPSGECIRFFARTDQAMETNYEMFRQNKMPETTSLVGQTLNFFLAPDEEGVQRKQLLDGSKLPEFAKVRHYFRPGGLRIHVEPDGWRITGCLLAREERSAAR
jgi:hypothetical protein